jgi:hypothetical protein
LVITPLISAETWLGSRRMRERQPDMQRHETGFGSGADQGKHENGCRRSRRKLPRADVGKGITARGTCEQSEHEQQREGAETRHDQIDVSGTHVVGHAVMRHDQRP